MSINEFAFMTTDIRDGLLQQKMGFETYRDFPRILIAHFSRL